MTLDRARLFLQSLPHVVETMQWGANLVFWVGDKAIGGKMFALIDLEPKETEPILSWAAGHERFHELVELDDLHPAPYFARIGWVATRSWTALRDREWEDEFRAAHQRTLAGLPKKVHAALALPERERNRLIREQRKLLAAKAEAAKAKRKP